MTECHQRVSSAESGFTCPVVQNEVAASVSDATGPPDRGDAGVVSVVLQAEIFQLQDLRLALENKSNLHCENIPRAPVRQADE